MKLIFLYNFLLKWFIVLLRQRVGGFRILFQCINVALQGYLYFITRCDSTVLYEIWKNGRTSFFPLPFKYENPFSREYLPRSLWKLSQTVPSTMNRCEVWFGSAKGGKVYCLSSQELSWNLGSRRPGMWRPPSPGKRDTRQEFQVYGSVPQ